MSAGLTITVYLALALIAGIAAGVIAPRKKRSQGVWTTLAFLFPPLLIVLLFLPKGRAFPPRPDREWDPTDNLDRL